ncbi:hypothetical protein [Spiroplasma endosymbiont of Colias croceus]|uniref:hypothetical protein n=2 Tax=unclassified Spiroplasma TaxID=2637901 RepID=UPI0030CF8167
MPLTKEESFLILDKEIKELDEKISYIDKKNTELKLNISLIKEEEFFTLDEEINELTGQIFDEEDKNIKLIGEIKVLEKNIKVLEKQKNQKNWKLTFLNVFTFGIFKYYKNKNIDKQIKEIKINRECLKQRINNNKNIIKLLKIKKLKIIKKTNILLKNLFFVNNRLIKINKEFFQQLDNLKNQIAKKIVVPINNDSSLEQNSSGYNSDDGSDIEVLSELEQENDNLKIYSKSSSINFERQLSDIPEEEITITSSSSDSTFNEDDDGSDIEVLSELEQENDNLKIYSKSSSINFERQLSDIPEEEITITSSSSDSTFNEDDDGSDIEVLSKSVEEEDAKIFGSCCFSQNLINNFAKIFSTLSYILQQSIEFVKKSGQLK